MTQRKNYNNLSHIPQYPELSCYAKKKKKTLLCGGVYDYVVVFLRLCVLTLQKDQCIPLLVV